jgi:hypothetical protein
MWTRRRFLGFSSYTLAAARAGGGLPGIGEPAVESRSNPIPSEPAGSRTIELFLCGDAMTGRGIDQILPHPSKPRIYEPAVSSALGYVGLAERANGPIPYPVDFSYVWGDTLAELRARAPDRRIVNLETSITTSEEALPKGINYRMHPRNVACLQAAGIDCCVLANNHVLDWGIPGLLETVELAASGHLYGRRGAQRGGRSTSRRPRRGERKSTGLRLRLADERRTHRLVGRGGPTGRPGAARPFGTDGEPGRRPDPRAETAGRSGGGLDPLGGQLGL